MAAQVVLNKADGKKTAASGEQRGLLNCNVNVHTL